MALDRTNYNALVDDTGGGIDGTNWNKNQVKIVILDQVDNELAVRLPMPSGRITLTASTPITTSDVTAATTIRYTPHLGNQVPLKSGSVWSAYTFSELTLSLGSDAANTPYDLYVFLNAGVPALERLAWTNDTTRATGIARDSTSGFYTKSGDATRLYVGTYRTTGSAGQTEDSLLKRFVWNYYNRVPRLLVVTDTTDSWSGSGNVLRQARGQAANQVDLVIGAAEVRVQLTATLMGANSVATTSQLTAIGEDSTSAKDANCLNGLNQPAANAIVTNVARLEKYPVIGRHFYAWLEMSAAGATATFYGDNGLTSVQSGLIGTIDG